MRKQVVLGLVFLLVLALQSVAFGQTGYIAPPTAWDEEYDVVVVGGGFAGLAAAYTAVQNGVSAVLYQWQ